MLRKILFISTSAFLGFGFSPDLSATASMLEACHSFGLTEDQRKTCLSTAEAIENDENLVAACAELTPDFEKRISCLKSGTHLEFVRGCTAQKWSLENKLTCIRYLREKRVLWSCLDFSQKEDIQVQCVKSGHEVNNIVACGRFSNVDKNKLLCLRHDLPIKSVEDCTNAYSKDTDRMKCLETFIAIREGHNKLYRGEILAEQAADRAREESNRKPASRK